MEKKLVSILIPVYNRLSLVSQTIESAINQTHRNIEIIICDNCSTDGTWKLLQNCCLKDNRIRIFRNETNIGPVKNWKRCIDEARGQYAKILYSDDLIDENFIEETMKVFDNRTAFVLSMVKTFNGNQITDFSIYKKKAEYLTSDYYRNILLNNPNGFPVSPGCALFRTLDLKLSLIIDIPNTLSLDFNRLGAGNDLLLFLNTANRYPHIKVVNCTTAFFRSHNESFTTTNNLDVYYDFAKYYFIKNNKPAFLSIFKTYLWYREKRDKEKKTILRLIEGKKDFLFLFRFILKNIARRF